VACPSVAGGCRLCAGSCSGSCRWMRFSSRTRVPHPGGHEDANRTAVPGGWHSVRIRRTSSTRVNLRPQESSWREYSSVRSGSIRKNLNPRSALGKPFRGLLVRGPQPTPVTSRSRYVEEYPSRGTLQGGTPPWVHQRAFAGAPSAGCLCRVRTRTSSPRRWGGDDVGLRGGAGKGPPPRPHLVLTHQVLRPSIHGPELASQAKAPSTPVWRPARIGRFHFHC
jgi:hypothetical protein